MKAVGVAAVVLAAMCSVVLAAPAPALTSVQVTKIVSTTVSAGESITASQTTSAKDHAGLITVTVREIGYASTRTATISGISMKLIKSTPIVSGGQIVGYDLQWQCTTWTAGQGTFNCSSKNQSSPYNSITDSIYVK